LQEVTRTGSASTDTASHDAQYWARVTKGLDFSDADRVDPLLYNRILWQATMAGKPYPPSLLERDGREDEQNGRSML